MTVDPTFDARFTGPPGALAANADRDRAIDVLKAGFAEGRLTRAEHDDRAARVYAARTYGELGWLIADLPAGPLGGPARYPGASYPGALYPLRQAVPPAVNSTAVTALVCGIGVFFTMGLTAIPAIVLGHMGRRQVRETGQRGDGMALTGLVLGWTGIALMAVLIVGLVAFAHTAQPVHAVDLPVIVHPVPGHLGGPINPGPIVGG
ncbi:MAG: DUF1707 and DUF4190 domain-containing protein [Trebonia sp.]